jgi:KDO2-lipid IV(A) palmitoleoyltransferase
LHQIRTTARAAACLPAVCRDEAATTSGTYMLARLAKPALITVVLVRKPAGKGYDLVIQPALQDYPIDDELAAAAYMKPRH